MKNIICILIFLSFSNCNDRKETIPERSINAKVSVKLTAVQTKGSESKIEIDYQKKDTLTKSSTVFKINGIKCYWELKLFIKEGDNGHGDGKLVLKSKQSNKTLLTNSDYYSLDDSYYTNSFNGIDFESLNIEAIKDLNFDGYKDFMIYGKTESGSAGLFYKVYLFNNKKKIFEQSETLSNYEIEIDTIHKTLSSYGKSGWGSNVSQIIYFGKKGIIKYTEITEREVISDEPKRLLKATYKKIIDKKIIETKIDTTNFEGW